MSEFEEGEHIDPTSEISLETVQKRATKGIVALTGRYVILYAVTFIAQGFLGAFLSINEWGVFAIVSAVINFLVYFSDVGLAASLIQSRGKITDDDLKTTFTVQQILVLSLISIVLIFSTRIQSFYGLSNEGLFLLYALALSFFLSSIKTIPSVLLERELRFEKLAIVSIVENLIYNVLLVICAWKGLGIMSFTIAVVARAVAGFVLLYSISPWIPRLGISLKSLKHLLKFGVPYQINTFLAVLKDDGLAIVLGKILGLSGMGILVWAQKWAQLPLRLFMDQVTKVTFPAFARMQDEPEHLAKSVTRSLFFVAFFVFPCVVGFVVLAPIIIHVIPRYEKWQPALIPLALVSVNTLFAGVTTPLTNLLNAIGKIRKTFGLMVMWTVLTWVFVPYLAQRYGVDGAALGYALVGSSSIFAILLTKRYVNFSLVQSILRPAAASIIMGVSLLFLRQFLPISLSSIWILIGVGAVVYGVSIIVLVGVSILEDAQKSAKTLFSK